MITRIEYGNLAIIPLRKGKKTPFFDVVRIAVWKYKLPRETHEKQLFYGVPKSYQYFWEPIFCEILGAKNENK